MNQFFNLIFKYCFETVIFCCYYLLFYEFHFPHSFTFPEKNQIAEKLIQSIKKPIHFEPFGLESKEIFIFNLIQKAWSVNSQQFQDLVEQKTISNPKTHFLFVSLISFLRSYSYSTSQISKEPALQVLSHNSVSMKQFALEALSNLPSSINFNFTLGNQDFRLYHLKNAIKIHDYKTVQQILEISNDFSLLFHLESSLLFISKSLVTEFLERSLLTSDEDSIVKSLLIFTEFEHIVLIIKTIRARKILDQRHWSIYQSTVEKLPSSDIQQLKDTIDDFALLCSVQLKISNVEVVHYLINQQSFTFSFMYIYLKSVPNLVYELCDIFVSQLSNADENSVDYLLSTFSLLLFVVYDESPITEIHCRFESDPEEINEELISNLFPFLFLHSPLVRREHEIYFKKLLFLKSEKLFEQVCRLKFDRIE